MCGSYVLKPDLSTDMRKEAAQSPIPFSVQLLHRQQNNDCSGMSPPSPRSPFVSVIQQRKGLAAAARAHAPACTLCRPKAKAAPAAAAPSLRPDFAASASRSSTSELPPQPKLHIHSALPCESDSEKRTIACMLRKFDTKYVLLEPSTTHSGEVSITTFPRECTLEQFEPVLTAVEHAAVAVVEIPFQTLEGFKRTEYLCIEWTPRSSPVSSKIEAGKLFNSILKQHAKEVVGVTAENRNDLQFGDIANTLQHRLRQTREVGHLRML